MRNPQNRIGLWLHFENAAYEKVSAYLQDWQPSPYWGKIQDVRVNPTVVSRIIPRELQEGAESWLVLYRANLPQELLILPFPESEHASILNDTKTFGSYLSALLEYVLGKYPNWYPYNGFRNLIEYINQKPPFAPPSPPQRFQVVRHHKPIEELLKKPEIRFYDEEQRETVTTFVRASQRIQQNRDELLVSLLISKNEEQVRELLQVFETSLLEESDRLSKAIEKEVPTIIKTFESVMDDETKTFLISAETVARFARKQLSDYFDFSLCSCGLWKAVERELNSSLISHLRMINGISGKDRKPITAIHTTVNYKAGSEMVNINRRERGSIEFEGKTLGNIQWLLHSAHRNKVADEIGLVLENESELLNFTLGLDEGSLAYLIGEVARIRNGHAHIKAMTIETYRNLRSLVLAPDDKPQASLLGRILFMKRAVEDYWTR